MDCKLLQLLKTSSPRPVIGASPLEPTGELPSADLCTLPSFTGLLLKFFEVGVCTPGGLFLGVWYTGGIDFWHFSIPTSLSQTEDQRNAEGHQ